VPRDVPLWPPQHFGWLTLSPGVLCALRTVVAATTVLRHACPDLTDSRSYSVKLVKEGEPDARET